MVFTYYNTGNNQRRHVLSHINSKNGQAIISVEFESTKDFEGKYDNYNVIITVFDLHENYLKKLFKKNDAEIKYEKEDLKQVNPQLYKWLRIFNSKSSNGSIPDSSEKSNDKTVNNDDLQFSDKVIDDKVDDYSYENLVKKPDMKITTLDTTVPSNRADIVYQAKKNAEKVGKISGKDKTVSVFVDDIGRDIVLSKNGLEHSLRRLRNIQTDANSFVTLKAGEILKNSIRINKLTPKKQNVDSSYVLVGVAKSVTDDLFVIRSVVNRYNNELMSMDVLYSVNAKKEPAVHNAPPITNNSLRITDSVISIADLLKYVKTYFPDILPESVLRHFG